MAISRTSATPAPWIHHDVVQFAEDVARVDTTGGMIRGYIRNGIFTFKGVPYGTPVSGAARFMPAKLAEPQPGVRVCLHYSNICPQAPQQPYGPGSSDGSNVEDQFLLQRTGGNPVGEDCLVLNLWTPEINGSAKRPVLVWLHGGGFAFGCGHDLAAYDGENLAHLDAVVITINHRLGLLGHLNLAQIGDERYAASGNISSLDQILALEWVRANITRFGGDPNNVMIFGQSGGGGKVTALLGMPKARGLFHKAAIESGSFPPGATMEVSTELARALLVEVGAMPDKLEMLHTLPVEHLIRAGFSAIRKVGRDPMMGWGPVVDGVYLPEQPYENEAPALSKDIPLLVGTNYHEFCNGVDNPDAYKLTEAEMEAKLMEQDKDKAPAYLAASRRLDPSLAPFDRLALLGNWFRGMAQRQVELKARQGGAPAYYYWFTWRTPQLGGRPGAFHSCEISFVFDNADKYEGYNGGGDVPRKLSSQISDAWLAFARRGNPNHSGLPHWPAYDPATAAVMRFDSPCRVEVDIDTQLKRALNQ